jgi:hypothetical protein
MVGEAVSDFRFKVAFDVEGVLFGPEADDNGGGGADAEGIPWDICGKTLFCLCGELSADCGLV